MVKRIDAESEWMRIDKVYGQPFPLDPNTRFGIVYSSKTDSDVQRYKYTCGVSGRAVKLDKQPDITEPVTPTVCLKEAEQLMNSHIERYYWREASGCLFLAGRQ